MFNNTKLKNNVEINQENKFHTIIKCECSRSDRLNKSFSLIIFKVGNNEEFIILTKFLGSRIRMSDQIGWFDNLNLGLLLPETSYDGAIKFSEEIRRAMDLIFKPLICQVYFYPSLEWEFDK